jgi:hypothetical protein
MHPLLQKKSTQIALVVFSTAIAVLSVRGFIFQVHQTHVRAVARDWSAAIEQSEKLPPGLGRAEDMLSRLKSVDLGYSPDEFKHAIRDYIAAFQNSLDEAKAGRDTSIPDKAMEEARLRMAAVAKKYD